MIKNCFAKFVSGLEAAINRDNWAVADLGYCSNLHVYQTSFVEKIVGSIQDELCVVLCSFHSFCLLLLNSNVETRIYEDKPTSEMPIEVRFLSRFLFSCNTGSSLLLERWDNSLSDCWLGLKVMKAINATKVIITMIILITLNFLIVFNLLCRSSMRRLSKMTESFNIYSRYYLCIDKKVQLLKKVDKV